LQGIRGKEKQGKDPGRKKSSLIIKTEGKALEMYNMRRGETFRGKKGESATFEKENLNKSQRGGGFEDQEAKRLGNLRSITEGPTGKKYGRGSGEKQERDSKGCRKREIRKFLGWWKKGKRSRDCPKEGERGRTRLLRKIKKSGLKP